MAAKRRKRPAKAREMETKTIYVTTSPVWERLCKRERVPIRVDSDPEPGYYVSKRGPNLIPCRVWIERTVFVETGELAADDKIVVMIDGRIEPIPFKAQEAWLYMQAISGHTYASMLKVPNRTGPGKRTPLKRAEPIF